MRTHENRVMLNTANAVFFEGGMHMKQKTFLTAVKEWIWKAWSTLFLAVALAG